MEPELHVGALALVKPVESSEIRVGDVITFNDPRQPGRLITHRVAEVVQRDEGGLAYRTKGDANLHRDLVGDLVSGKVGRYSFDVPYIGYALVYAKTREVRTGLILVSSLLLLFDPALDLAPEQPAVAETACAHDPLSRRHRRRPAGGIPQPRAPTCGTSAAFTASLTASGSVTVDRLGNYFEVTPGAAVRLGTRRRSPPATSIRSPSPSAPSRRRARSRTSHGQEPDRGAADGSPSRSPARASSRARSSPRPAPAPRRFPATRPAPSRSRRPIRSPAAGAGTIQLRHASYTWMYRDYATTIDPRSRGTRPLTATQRPPARSGFVGRVDDRHEPRGYNVYRNTGTGAFTKLNPTPLAATTYDDLATVNGTTYTYMVRALTTAGVTLESLDSPTPTAVADATPPGQPSTVALANGGAGAPT